MGISTGLQDLSLVTNQWTSRNFEPCSLIYTRTSCTVQENNKIAFTLGLVEKLDNNNHKPVQGQWAQKTQSRSHKGTFTDTPLQVNWSNLKKNMEKGRDLASRGRFWMDESSGQLKMQRLTECVQVHEAENSRQKEQHREMGNVQMIWSLSVDSVQFLS